MQSQQAISDLAYALWQARGCPEGSALVDWSEAERQVTAAASDTARPESDRQENSLEHSFPASDPPSSNLPDEPPSNAAEKWATSNLERDDTERDAATAK